MGIARALVIGHYLVFIMLSLPFQSALAHQPSQSFLNLKSDDGTMQWTAQWDIALRDLDMVLDLDANLDGRLTRAEVTGARREINALALNSATFVTEATVCSPGPIDHSLAYRGGIGYARLSFTVDCPSDSRAETLDYRLFERYDAGHRVWLTTNQQQRVLQPGDSGVLLGANERQLPGWSVFANFVREGIHHILIGWDHLAFVIALLVGLLLGRATPDKETAELRDEGNGFFSSLKSVVKVITIFTIAHSITLALAATGVVKLPSGPVEALIAASIAVLALAALFRSPGKSGRSKRRLYLVTFGFGLIHGLGFANALGGAGAVGESLILGLIGFNMGVEIGQILFVAAVLPLFWLAALTRNTRRISSPLLSLALLFASTGWLVERVFDLSLIPG